MKIKENEFNSIEKEILLLSYQEKQLYLQLLNDKKEIDILIDKLKNKDNFFLKFIDLNNIDKLGLIRIHHKFIYGQLDINSCSKLKKEVYIDIVNIVIANNIINENMLSHPYYFKYLDFSKFTFDEIQEFFIEFCWNRNFIIESLEEKDKFYLKYINFNSMEDKDLKELFIYTHITMENDWINKIIIWSDEYDLNLPKNKVDLLSLDKIIANDSSIKYIPKEIGKLQSLTEIDFSNINISIFDDNSIENIPKEIYNLPSLTKLNISNNKIKNIPMGIRKLSNLIELNISNNKIKEIPEELSELIDLKNLYISDVGMSSISKRIFSKSKIDISKKFINLKKLMVLDEKSDTKKSSENIADFFIRKNYNLI